MSKFVFAQVIPAIVGLAGIILIWGWLWSPVGATFTLREPGSDGVPERITAGDSQASLAAGALETFSSLSSKLEGAWPRFRGPDFDAVSKETTPLARSFGPNGPEVLWSVQLGEGYAAPAVLNGMVYLLDYDMQTQSDALRCFSLDTGEEIWRYSYPVKIKRNHGMSRTTPAVTDKYVVTIGPKCHVLCLDSVTGNFLWGIDLVKDFGTKVPLWYAGQCPLIDNDKAIIAPAGTALMLAVDCATGEIVWQAENPFNWEMTHSSIIPAEFAGKRFYIYCASGGVAGVSAEDGSILWTTDAWKMRTNVPSPVVVGHGLLFFSAGYNKGSLMLRLTQQAENIIPEVLFELRPDVFGADQQTPIFYDGYIYGVRPDEQFVCLDLEGNILWTSGPDYKFGYGAFTMTDTGIVYIMNDDGLLTLAEVSPQAFTPLDQARILTGHESWGPLALASGRLLARDLTSMVCIKISAD